MRNGDIVRKHFATSFYRCTLGWMIWKGSSLQFLTNGHCTYVYSGTDWWHFGYSGGVPLGNEVGGANLLASGYDAMRVTLPAGQGSALIYGSSRHVKSERYAVQGEYICASLGATDFVDCGNVLSSYSQWTNAECGCTQHGATYSGIYATEGDSGSPIYLTGPTLDVAAATGILATKFSANNGQGNFVRTHDLVQIMGISIFTD
jgi:hypothetical protein